MYHSNITLILIEEAARAIDDRAYLKKLDLLFDALVLMYGLDDLVNISNVEKFKKEIKVIISYIKHPDIRRFIC